MNHQACEIRSTPVWGNKDKDYGVCVKCAKVESVYRKIIRERGLVRLVADPTEYKEFLAANQGKLIVTNLNDDATLTTIFAKMSLEYTDENTIFVKTTFAPEEHTDLPAVQFVSETD
jgi:hypothetical protein